MFTTIRNRGGFTIVELLIVIVVIAILAAISIVAYNGIQNRANDTTVKSDLANFDKTIRLASVDTDGFPVGGAINTGSTSTGNSQILSGVSFPFSRSAYFQISGQNLYYCQGTVSGVNTFRITARSKSGETFVRDSSTGLASLGKVAPTLALSCQGFDIPHTWAYGYGANDWKSWTTN